MTLPLHVLEAAIAQSWNAVVITTGDHANGYPVIYANRAFCQMTGYSEEELIGQSLKILQGPETDTAVLQRLRTCLAVGSYFEGQTFNYKKDGTRYLVRWNITPVHTSDLTISHYVSVQVDLTELFNSQTRNSFLEEILRNIDEPIIIIGHDFKIDFCNKKAKKLFGNILNNKLIDTLMYDPMEKDPEQKLIEIKGLSVGDKPYRSILKQKTSSGSSVFVHYTISAIANKETGFLNYMLLGKDISDHIERERSLLEEAHTDKLTGLMNRGYGETVLAKVLASEAPLDEPHSLLILDIDHFKTVNDNFGHAVGDRALRKVAEVLLKTTRKSDIIIRWGGEEFVIILQNVNKRKAIDLAERIRQTASEINDPVFGRLTLSIGLGSMQQSEDKDSFIKRVDLALYDAKRNGRNRIALA